MIKVIFLLALLFTQSAQADLSAPRPWQFVVSGDTHGCGDLLMPVIAQGANEAQARFYWHLGDSQKAEWPSFVEKQIKPFTPTTVYLVIGSGDLIGHNREEYRAFFHDWIDAPGIRETRAHEDLLEAAPQTYYHWIQNGIDFIALDNATRGQLDAAQMVWLEKVITRDAGNQAVKTVVMGMNAAVSPKKPIFQDLLKPLDQAHKTVYVLTGSFNSEYGKSRGNGYLLAKVEPQTGQINFEFVPLRKNACD